MASPAEVRAAPVEDLPQPAAALGGLGHRRGLPDERRVGRVEHPLLDEPVLSPVEFGVLALKRRKIQSLPRSLDKFIYDLTS